MIAGMIFIVLFVPEKQLFASCLHQNPRFWLPEIHRTCRMIENKKMKQGERKFTSC